MKTVKAFAPATVANVCCGFDILGFSVDSPGDEVILTERNEPGVVVKRIVGDGGRLPLEANLNTASVAVQSFLNAIGSNKGIEIELFKNLPLGSGMGSSAASAVAALVGVNHLFGNPLTREELIPHAMEAERIACGSAHADNVGPSLLGGFVLVRDYHPLDVVKIPVKANLYCTLAHPQIELKTEDARRVLKSSVDSLISRSLKDVIAEPVRSVFIPGFDVVRSEAVKAGALGCGISGSGPTMFALSASHEIALKVGETMQRQFLKYHLKSEVYVSKINLEGAKIVDSN
jgi:homoserine kinase